MKHLFKISAISAGLFLMSISTVGYAQTTKPDTINAFVLKVEGTKELTMVKRGRRGRDNNNHGSEGSGRRSRTPGGAGCDDPHDIVEHPECSAGASSSPSGGGSSPAAAEVASVEISPSGDVEIRFTNGWKEEITDGRYEVKNANNRTVLERMATPEDVARIMTLAGF